MSGGLSALEEMKKEILAQSESTDEVIEFVFEEIQIGQFTPEMAKLFTKYTKLISLEFVDCGIKTLAGFPTLQNLMKLNLEDNQLTDSAVKQVSDLYPNLHFLGLSGNKIQNIDSVKALYGMSELQQLFLKDNPVFSNPKLRELLFSNCKALQVLDDLDKDGQEVFEDDDDDDDDEDKDDDEDDEDDLDVGSDEDIDSDEDEEEEEDEEPVPSKKVKH